MCCVRKSKKARDRDFSLSKLKLLIVCIVVYFLFYFEQMKFYILKMCESIPKVNILSHNHTSGVLNVEQWYIIKSPYFRQMHGKVLN